MSFARTQSFLASLFKKKKKYFFSYRKRIAFGLCILVGNLVLRLLFIAGIVSLIGSGDLILVFSSQQLCILPQMQSRLIKTHKDLLFSH